MQDGDAGPDRELGAEHVVAVEIAEQPILIFLFRFLY